MSYKLPKTLSCISSILTSVLVAVFLANDYKNISIDDLTYQEKLFTGFVIFSEINLGLIMFYIILSCMWSGMILCCNDEDTTTFQFSIYKILFILSGIGSNFYLFYRLIYESQIIDNLITASGWLLISNMFFVFLSTVTYKIYKLKYGKNNYQEF